MVREMSDAFFILILMILGHLIADYSLQGWLAQAKQKSYWEQYDKKYQADYIPALMCHATMWGIMIFIPLVWFDIDYVSGWVWLTLPINIAIHYVVDDLKANKKIINLWQDQLLHFIQILTTWLFWLFVYWL